MNELHVRQREVALPSGDVHDASFFFSSPRGCVETPDSGALLPFEHRRDVVPQVTQALSRRSHQARHQAIVAGAVPFDASRLPHLRMHAHGARDVHGGSARRSDMLVVQSPREIAMQPTPAAFLDAVANAVDRIGSEALKKVVLARTLDLTFGKTLELQGLRSRLAAQNPSAFIFSCDVSKPGAAARRTIVGASPELLVAKRGSQVSSHPLAGSLPRCADAAQDCARAERLRASLKNQHEHALVIEAVGDTLAPYCRSLQVPKEPALVQTGAMWHLGTQIVGELRDPDISSLELALALHPTPAVGGVPRPLATATIAELEGFDRGFFAGFVGYCDGAGDGEWAVTIRCAEAAERTLRLYAGAGIVGDSVPADELAETAAKLRTMLRALGFEQLLEAL